MGKSAKSSMPLAQRERRIMDRLLVKPHRSGRSAKRERDTSLTPLYCAIADLISLADVERADVSPAPTVVAPGFRQTLAAEYVLDHARHARINALGQRRIE